MGGIGCGGGGRKKSTRGEGEVEVEGEDRCRNKARPLSKFGGRAHRHRHWTDTGSFGKGKPAHQVIFFSQTSREGGQVRTLYWLTSR